MELSFYALYLGMYPATPCRKYCHLENIERGHPHWKADRIDHGKVKTSEVSMAGGLWRWNSVRLSY